MNEETLYAQQPDDRVALGETPKGAAAGPRTISEARPGLIEETEAVSTGEAEAEQAVGASAERPGRAKDDEVDITPLSQRGARSQGEG
jgi:hypothetical protein